MTLCVCFIQVTLSGDIVDILFLFFAWQTQKSRMLFFAENEFAELFCLILAYFFLYAAISPFQ